MQYYFSVLGVNAVQQSVDLLQIVDGLRGEVIRADVHQHQHQTVQRELVLLRLHRLRQLLRIGGRTTFFLPFLATTILATILAAFFAALLAGLLSALFAAILAGFLTLLSVFTFLTIFAILTILTILALFVGHCPRVEKSEQKAKAKVSLVPAAT
ncbi:hypothetical protein TYRP_003507 [Tyrophagus putrescentiae]|nr:hypothetical protein TYRP_003507 [Tyrophagus putrescentiae]